ncbi:hypothetical protein BTO06_04090 [Tenacibaculum sp. SZ-18]|uniref:ArdC family protein n=1 Tax=Tenacibaculum sp. SZ-18 TaxID=754423 RepID=UPI000C2D004C|nr:zincin-like metallopeptidase domain-containing protein [Tenacibaculum sp. SZ-18]AUC14373.1 hypothetical protein BTO06_04090 [Tenacibaculum sp. SZ-18]
MVADFINQYNALDKTTVERAKLVAINSKAELLSSVSPTIQELFTKTKTILENSDAEKFEINISSKLLKEKISLDDSEIKGLGIPLIDLPEDIGLNGKVSQSDIYQMITDQMIQMIEEASGKNWVQSWKANPFITPLNFISKKPYRGINHNLLTIFGFRTFKNPYFLTFKQIEKLKGRLKKGSKGYPVIYYTRLFIYESVEEGLKFATYDVRKFIIFLKANKSKIRLLRESKFSIEELVGQSYIPIMKYYKIFNGEDVENIDFKLEELRKSMVRNDGEKLQVAEAIIKNFPAPIPELKHGGDRAFYTPGKDYVQMPKIERFDTELDYYRTLFHEYIHATGHEERLDRKLSMDQEQYAKEELVAEFGAVFLSAEAGIIWRTNKNHAEYLKGWRNALKDIKKDNKLILRASSLAQKATDYILQRDKEGTPLYLKKMKKELSKKEFDFSFKKLISEKTIFSHVNKGYNLEKISDALLSKAYAYSLLAKHILSNSRNYPHYKKSSLLTEAGKTSLIKKMKTEIEKRHLKIAVNFSIPKQQRKPRQLELGLKGAGDVLLDLETNNQPTIATTVVAPVVIKEEETKVQNNNLETTDENISSTPVIDITKNEELSEYEKKMQKLGYVKATSAPKQASGIYRLPGEIGKFLQNIQPYKELIIIKGNKHSSKSQLAMQIANGFGELNKKVVYIDYEQGGMECKDTIDSLNRNTTPQGKRNILVKGYVEKPLQELKAISQINDVIVADSVTDLKITADQLNELRNQFPEVIWVFISQVKENGRMYGGNKMAHNPTKIIYCHSNKNYEKRFAELEKNRGNSLEVTYNIFEKKTTLPEEESGDDIIIDL